MTGRKDTEMFATDWTYDLYIEDIKKHEALKKDEAFPEDYRAYFAGYMKGAAERFLEKWLADHEGRRYDKADGYVGDAFADTLRDGFFSDFYKDAYGQRPHLPLWYYIQGLGLPMQEDIARTFCASPVEEAVEAAKWNREHF